VTTTEKESRSWTADAAGVDFEEKKMINFAMPRLLKSAMTAGALLTLGGCMYGGAGYYGDGYASNRGYACDPYAPFDDYYACDYGYGFANIGYGGGWYDQFYYPGYGIYVFDRGGHRHAMRNNHRRHWARQRAQYGGHHARDRNPERRTERRDRQYDRGDVSRDQRRGSYDGNRGVRDNRGIRPQTRTTRRDGTVQAAPVRNRADRTRPAVSRPTIAVEQPQTRPQPAARPVPRTEGPRHSPRTSRSERGNVVDD
jgi:hypothetical protein